MKKIKDYVQESRRLYEDQTLDDIYLRAKEGWIINMKKKESEQNKKRCWMCIYVLSAILLIAIPITIWFLAKPEPPKSPVIKSGFIYGVNKSDVIEREGD